MADTEEMVPSPLSVEEEDELWTGKLILLKWLDDESGGFKSRKDTNRVPSFCFAL